MDTDSEVELRNAVENFRQNLRHSINPKNLNRFISSYMQRKTLTDNLAGLKCPVLLITGSLSSQRRACRQLFEDLQRAQKHAEGRLTTREFFVIDGVANVIAERPDKVITSMQFFLQGIGLCELLILTLRDPLCHSAIFLLNATVSTKSFKHYGLALITIGAPLLHVCQRSRDLVVKSQKVPGHRNFVEPYGNWFYSLMLLRINCEDCLSNLQMQKTPLQLNRRMSMEDYDRPLGKLHFVNRLSHRLSEETDS
ncbi:hypothetical protein X801_09275 [Opisthorchis viverrini]|uniref:Uncharacterized protein n=1 Tax=Opisthorchis viverrini TaxID=6198 RepID=A0A1S8WKG6_OPIVI|nr:hypothetical protein X801_09275 [Opisthorchis viverrini]